MLWYLLLIIFCYFLFRLAQQASYWRLRKVPSDNIPLIIGIVLSLFKTRLSLTEQIKQVYTRYPKSKYFGYHDFVGPALLIRDPELVRDIGIKAFDCFPNHNNVFTDENDSILSNNLLALKGQRWKDIRNLLTPSFTAAKMKLMFGLIDDCAREFVQHLSGEFDAKDVFTKYTCDVIATAAFGLEVNSLKDPENQFYKAGIQTTDFNFAKIYKMLIVSKIPFLNKIISSSFVDSGISEFFHNLIENTIKERKEKGIVRPDMIQLMMEASEKENGFEVTMKDIVAQSFIFFLGGFDTSSNFMCVVTYELAGNQEVQENLRQEVDQFFQDKKDEKVTYDEVNKLKYLDMVLSETLRFYPPGVMTDRVCVKEFQLPAPMDGYPGYKVEPGVICYMSIIGMHMDPLYFSDPEKFDPERFSEERKHEINPYTYIPFGLGPRRCIGDRFALMETKILIVHLVKNFVIKLSDKTKYPMAYDRQKLSMTPQGGFNVKLEKRHKID